MVDIQYHLKRNEKIKTNNNIISAREFKKIMINLQNIERLF